MIKTTLEEYFLYYIAPLYSKSELKNSNKTETGLSLRENLGLVIATYFIRWLNKTEAFIPAISKDYDDGAIADNINKRFISVEQVYVYEGKWDNDPTRGIQDALERKTKGEQYARGSILVIFCNSVGDFKPESIKSEIQNNQFETILIVGPDGEREFDFNIILAKNGGEVLNSCFKSSINKDTGTCIVNAL